LPIANTSRKLAAKVGVDPYTDFPPLDAKLSRLAEAAVAGGFTVSAAMMAVPVTTVGIVVSNLGTASTIEGVRIDELARDQTASQIFDINREKLHGMGADIDLTEALLVNRNYTPIDMAVLVAALDSMPGVEDRIVENQRVRASFSGADGRWMEWVWKDSNTNFLPESGSMPINSPQVWLVQGDPTVYTVQPPV